MRAVRIHPRKNMQARLRENLVMMVICGIIMLWVLGTL